MAGALVISLDFELIWGVLDRSDRRGYLSNLMGARRVVPALLERFVASDIHATWATVGMLAHHSREELRASLPTQRPTYQDPSLDAYGEVASVGQDEHADPLHLAGRLVAQVASTPGQELGTHTFCHYYALEPGQTREQFAADLESATRALSRFGPRPRSLVFPRNQINPAYLDVVSSLGIVAVRGNQCHHAFEARPASQESLARRALRFADSLLPIDADPSYSWEWLRRSRPAPTLVNVRASAFLRPRGAGMARGALGALQVRRVVSALWQAAASKRIFHLWWHPHNFGRDIGANLAALDAILREYRAMRRRFGFESLSMGEVAARALASA
jgi:peptidoglycan/xylan/chitin deacetylase (PgdA/CDA1 family)